MRATHRRATCTEYSEVSQEFGSLQMRLITEALSTTIARHIVEANTAKKPSRSWAALSSRLNLAFGQQNWSKKFFDKVVFFESIKHILRYFSLSFV